MPSYRAYFLDEDDHISGVEIIDAADLSEAAQLGLKMLDGLPQVPVLELWEGDKLRCALPPSIYVKRARDAARARSDELAVRAKTEPIDMTAITSRLASARARTGSNGKPKADTDHLESGANWRQRPMG